MCRVYKTCLCVFVSKPATVGLPHLHIAFSKNVHTVLQIKLRNPPAARLKLWPNLAWGLSLNQVFLYIYILSAPSSNSLQIQNACLPVIRKTNVPCSNMGSNWIDNIASSYLAGFSRRGGGAACRASSWWRKRSWATNELLTPAAHWSTSWRAARRRLV